MPPPLVLYGAYGHAVAFKQIATQSYGMPLYEVVAYIDDFSGGTSRDICGVPVISFENWQTQYQNIDCIITIGDPKARMKLAWRIIQHGGNFGTIYAPFSSIAPDITVGQGSTISPHGWIGPFCNVGEHVQIQQNCSLGHDIVIEDFVTICHSTSISGYVRIERGAFLGTGVIVINGSQDQPLTIGAGANVYAGAVVTKSVPPNAVVAGNPARSLRKFLKHR